MAGTGKTGPLAGLRVVELAGLGPAPFCCMVLADLGADVVRVDRAGASDRLSAMTSSDYGVRGRRRIAVDVKRPEGRDIVLRIAETADVLVEGFRPGVMERLGLGPDVCLERNPRLVFTRVTGWGQDGPLAQRPGHDINYIALTGALSLIGREGQPPSVPPALVGDFGGGGMLAIVGVLAAIVERAVSGRGQVVDSSIIDGAALLTTTLRFLADRGELNGRGTNEVDGGAPYYDVFETADGGHVTFGAIEPRFYMAMLEALGLEADMPQGDRAGWPELKRQVADVIGSRTRAEWQELLESSETCFAPMLTLDEAPAHPHHRARATFVEVGGVTQPAPAPRFDRTPPGRPEPTRPAGADTRAILRSIGLADSDVDALLDAGVVTAR